MKLTYTSTTRYEIHNKRTKLDGTITVAQQPGTPQCESLEEAQAFLTLIKLGKLRQEHGYYEPCEEYYIYKFTTNVERIEKYENPNYDEEYDRQMQEDAIERQRNKSRTVMSLSK
tara:strand:- start:4130 stop:4474 length:345 start_codon:yes stop_codon:yes gene_type:complete